jgi:hypothetical protein
MYKYFFRIFFEIKYHERHCIVVYERQIIVDIKLLFGHLNCKNSNFTIPTSILKINVMFKRLLL